MKNNNKENNENQIFIKKNNSFQNFRKKCISYSSILSNILENQENAIFSKDDILIIKDLIKEMISYSQELVNNGDIEESKNLIEIGKSITNNFYLIYNKFTKKPILLKFPLTLKLYILEADFNINFKFKKDYIYSEKIIMEIIDIQKKLNLSTFFIASSYFYLGIIYFLVKRFEDSEKIIKLSLTFLTPLEYEINNNNTLSKTTPLKLGINKNFKKESISYNIIIKKFCNSLSMLAEIYLLKNEYTEAFKCIKHAFTLNLQNYGNNHKYTIYFENKLNSISKNIKEYFPLDYKILINKENNKEIKNICTYNNILKYINNTENKRIEGKTKFFAYIIENTHLYQPMIISLYNLNENDIKENNYSPKYFIHTLYFNKSKLLDFFGEENANNAYYYLDKNINKILKQIKYRKNSIYINNKKLKSCLMWE